MRVFVVSLYYWCDGNTNINAQLIMQSYVRAARVISVAPRRTKYADIIAVCARQLQLYLFVYLLYRKI